MAASCEMKDKLRVNSSASQVVVSTFSYPWSVKPSFSREHFIIPPVDYTGTNSAFEGILRLSDGISRYSEHRRCHAGRGRERRSCRSSKGKKLLACDLLDVKTRNHVATAIDEGSYNLLEFDYWMISTDILEESHVEMDCYGILNGVSEEEEYSDTIILQAVDKERHISDYDGVATVLRLPWRIDHGEGFVGKVEKSFAPPTEEVKRQHDGEDDGDWIEIGLNGLEKGSELAENIGGSDIKEDMHKSFISDADDPIEDLHLQVKELPRNSEQLNEKPRSSSGRPKVFKSEQVVQRGLWQELRSTVADILKQPVLMQSILWFLVTQLVIHNSSFTMLCCQTDSMQAESSFLRASPMIIWSILIMTTFLFNQYLKHLPLRRIKP
ncbi:uncharacterized protein [Physcomitrium patens]|uniref:uncharacterized protein isoform X4 n=1 Tax=Physcomitrium patens TaxID=3218 RepID=UPI003CCE44B8